MYVLNNNNGQLLYNRCSFCTSFLNCKSSSDCAPNAIAGVPGCTQCPSGERPSALEAAWNGVCSALRWAAPELPSCYSHSGLHPYAPAFLAQRTTGNP